MANQNYNWSRPGWLSASLGVAIGMVLAGALVLAPQQAVAVHDDTNTPFELDGDPTDESLLDDWDSVFGLGPPPYPSPRGDPGDGVDPGETFVIDSADPDDTAFTQSNKDVDEVNSWSYGVKGISPPKDDITNAYAKAYLVDHDNDGNDDPGDTPDHLIIYFGSDRFADDGDAAMGYWFFRNDVGLGANNKFSGTHAVGDVLIQIDYRGAGDNEIEVFKWVGSGGNAGQGKLQRLAIGTSSNPADTICTASNPGSGIPADSACVTTNIVEEDSPWTYVGKGEDFVGQDRFPPRVFMEGGFDVTALVGNVCFSDFMAETRSSHSETASLKDFALGNFDLCSIDVEKTCLADSQVVNPDETFTTTHLVTIDNNGFAGSLKDVELSDTTTTADSTCEITSVVSLEGNSTGLAGVGEVFDSASDSVEVADTLNGSIRVALECTSPDNPFRNAVAVKARSGAGAPQDITDTDLESTVEAGVCEATLNVGLAIKKWCQGDDGEAVGHPMGANPYFYGIAPDDPAYDPTDPAVDSNNPLELGVFLKPPNYAPEVCVDIEIANTSANQRMVFDGDDVDCTTADFDTELEDYICDTDLGNLVPSTGLTLEPAGDAEGDDKFHIARCYTPTGPDGSNGTDPVDPTHALYSDTARAQAHGKLDDVDAKTLPVTASCELCPPHD